MMRYSWAGIFSAPAGDSGPGTPVDAGQDLRGEGETELVKALRLKLALMEAELKLKERVAD